VTEESISVVVGIGNPGRQYAHTRHNVGFDVVDALARSDGIDIARRRFDALLGEGAVAGKRVVLVKPQTYVNNSGYAVRQAADWWKVAPERVLVVCDDANLPLGRIRFRREGSSGGHNGLESIITHLGTEQFPRLRIGIGRTEGGLVGHVLGRFSAAERKVMDEVCIDAMRGIVIWLTADIERCMNEFNG
jgi:PTH1 family peptidyl-tRNA hydrolase